MTIMPGQTTQTRSDLLWANLGNFVQGYALQAFLPGEALQFKNVMLQRDFRVVPRWGTEAVSAQPPTSALAQAFRVTGTYYLYVFDGKVGHRTGSPAAYAELFTGGTSGVPVFLLPFGSYVAIIGLVPATPKKYTGAAVANLAGAPPAATCGAVYAGRIFLASNVTNPNRLYFSEANDGENWPGTNWIVIGDTSTVIYSLLTLGDGLYIYTNKDIWQLTGRTSNDFYLRTFQNNLPLVSGTDAASVAPIGEGSAMFVSGHRLWRHGAGALTDLSEQVTSYSNLLASNSNSINRVCFWSAKYGLLFLSTPSYTLVYDMAHKTWSYWTLSVSCFSASEIPGDTMIFMGTRDGKFIAMSRELVADYNGVYALAVQTPFTDLGLPDWEKHARYLMLEGTADNPVTVKLHHRMSGSGSYTTVTYSSVTLPKLIKIKHTRFVEMSVELTLTQHDNLNLKAVRFGFFPIRRRR